MFERLMFRTSLHSAINLALYKELNLKCQITSVITMNKNISVKIFPFLDKINSTLYQFAI